MQMSLCCSRARMPCMSSSGNLMACLGCALLRPLLFACQEGREGFCHPTPSQPSSTLAPHCPQEPQAWVVPWLPPGTATPVQHHSTAFPSSGGSSSPVHHIPSPTGVSELLVDTQALQLLQVPMLKTSTGWGCRQKDTEKSTPSGVVGGQAEGRGHRSRMLWEVPPGCLCSPRSRAGVPADTWAPALERKLLCSAAATLYEEGNLAGATRPQSRGSLAAGAAGSAAGLPQDPSAPRCGSGPGAVPRPSHLPLC